MLTSPFRHALPTIQYFASKRASAAAGTGGASLPAYAAPTVAAVRVSSVTVLGSSPYTALPSLPPPFVTANGKLVADDPSGVHVDVDVGMMSMGADTPVHVQLGAGCEALSTWCHAFEEEVTDVLAATFRTETCA